MKTLTTVVNKIQSLQNKIYEVDHDDNKLIKQKNRDRKELQFLEVVKKYLMSQPSENFVLTESKRLEKLIESVMDRFCPPDEVTKAQLSILRKEHEREYGIPKLRKQLTTIRFILAGN